MCSESSAATAAAAAPWELRSPPAPPPTILGHATLPLVALRLTTAHQSTDDHQQCLMLALRPPPHPPTFPPPCTVLAPSSHFLAQSTHLLRSFPSEIFLDELLLSRLDPSAIEPEVRAALWGWDAVGPAGLCQRVYSFLQLPRKVRHDPCTSSSCTSAVVGGTGVQVPWAAGVVVQWACGWWEGVQPPSALRVCSTVLGCRRYMCVGCPEASGFLLVPVCMSRREVVSCLKPPEYV